MSAPPDSDERRSDPRHPIELKVEYKRLNAFFADYTKNISRGGTFIQTDKPLPVGTEFVFKLYVPTLEEPLRIRGRVKWVVEAEAAEGVPQGQAEGGRPATQAGGAPGMGIRFVYSTDDERRQVERAVERLMVDSLGHLVFRKLMDHGDRRNKGGGEGGNGDGEAG